MKPLVVVEQGDAAVAQAVAELRAAGFRIVEGWEPRGDLEGVVRSGIVDDEKSCRTAVLAVLGGSGVVVDARAGRAVIDQLCDDLRRFGPVDHRVGPASATPQLSDEERCLLDLLAEGCTLRDAATRLHLSRRTADRRLAAARGVLGAATTAEAVLRWRQRDRRPDPQT